VSTQLTGKVSGAHKGIKTQKTGQERYPKKHIYLC